MHHPPGSTFQITTEPLAANEHHYHVVEYSGGNANVCFFRQASALAKVEMQLGPGWHWGFYNGLPHVGVDHPGIDLPSVVMAVRCDDRLDELTEDDLCELRRGYTGLLAHDEQTIALKQITSDYVDLRRVSEHSSLRFLGLFALLEALITHAPGGARPVLFDHSAGDQEARASERRFPTPLPYEEHFPSTGHDAVWTKLQAVRSRIAHGQRPAFDRKLAPLRDLGNAERFVRTTLKSVMSQALAEPRLIADLRDC